MSIRLLLNASLVAVALASGGVAEPARAGPPGAGRPLPAPDPVTVVVNRPPPPPLIEPVRPRPGYLWAHGYWRWNGRDYVAVPGHWERLRPGHLYVPPHWERRPDGWHWRVGAWVSD